MFSVIDRAVADELNADRWPLWRKKTPTRAIRMTGRFEVVTREGLMSCEDGYLAIDNNGDPYPIARDVFEATYEAAS